MSGIPLCSFVTYAPEDYALSNYGGIGAKTELQLAYGVLMRSTHVGVSALLVPRRARVWNVIHKHAGTRSAPSLATHVRT